MKIAKRTLSVFLSLLMIFSACSVCLSGFSLTAAAASSYTVAQVKNLVTAAASSASSSSSSGNSWNFTGDDGKVLAAAEAVYDYAVNGVRTTGTTASYNSSDTLYNRVISLLGYSAGSSQAEFVKKVLYPNGTTTYGYSSRQSKSGSWEDRSSMSNGTNLTNNGNVSYNGNVSSSVTKTSAVTVDVNSYLLTFDSIADIPQSFPTKITYKYTHTTSKSASQTSQSQRTVEEGSGCDAHDVTYYTHKWTSYIWNYLSSATRTVNSTNTTAKAELQSYASYFDAARLGTAAEDMLGMTAAELQTLYDEAVAKYNEMNTNYATQVISHFFDTAAIETYLNEVLFAKQVVMAQPQMQILLANTGKAYDNQNYTEMEQLYTVLTNAYDVVKDYPAEVFDFVVANYEGYENFSLENSKEFMDALYYDMELYQLRVLKNSIDADIAANEAKLADPENKDDITDIELAALKDKFNGYEKAWNQFSAEAVNEVFADGFEYISTFRTAIQTKIDTRDAQVEYDAYFTYFIPYIFANIASWTNDEVQNRYNLDTVKQTALNNTYNTYKGVIGEELTASVFTFTYEEQDYLLTTAVADYIARLKQNIIDRNNAQLDIIKSYADMSTTINFENFIGVKTSIDKFDQTLYDYANGKGWVDSAHKAIYNSINGLLAQYNSFVASGGLPYTQKHYHDANGIYITRYAGDQTDENGNQLGYENDIARDGADDNYDVTEQKVLDTVEKLDKFITSEDFCNLVGLESEEGVAYSSLSEAIDEILTSNLFTNDMVNTLVGALFPMVCDLIPELLGDLGSLGIDGITTSPDPNAAARINLGAFGVSGLGGTLDLYVDGQQGTSSIRTLMQALGVYIYPADLASKLPSGGKYTAIKSALNAAGTNWSSLLDEEGKVNFDWGVTDYDSFTEVVGNVFNSILPLLQTVLAGATLDKYVGNAAYAIGTISYDTGVWPINTVTPDVKVRAGAQITIPGLNVYKTLWIPLMEALGVTDFNPNYSFSIPSASADGPTIAKCLFDPVMELIEQLKYQPIERVCEMLPSLIYALSMDKLQDIIDSTVIPITAKLNVERIDEIKLSGAIDWLLSLLEGTIRDAINNNLSPFKFNVALGDMVNLKDMLGFEYTNINALLDYLFDTLGIDLQLPTMNAGEIILCSSYVTNAPSARGTTRLRIDADVADVFYVLLNYIVKAIGDRTFVENIIEFIQNMNAEEGSEPEPIELPELVYNIIANVNGNPKNALAALVELFNPVKYDTEEYDWYESGYNYGDIQGVNDASIVYLNYGNNWTKAKAEYVVNNVDALLESVLELTGAEETQINVALQNALAGLFNNEAVTGMVGGLVTLGVALNNDFVYDLIEREFGVDLTIWYDAFGYLFPDTAAEYGLTPVAPGEAGYVNDTGVTASVSDEGVITWNYNGAAFADGDREAFVGIFCGLCDEFAPLIALIFKGEDLALFNDAITILGYESYANSVGVLFEMLGITDVMDQVEYNAYCDANGDAAAFNYLTNQLFDWVDYMLEGNTIKKTVDLLPKFIYFVQSNGLSTTLHNMLMPILVLLDDVRPIIDIDVNAIVSVILSDLLNTGTVDLNSILDLLSGTYKPSEDPEYKYIEIDLGNLTLGNVIKIADDYLGTKLYDSQLVQAGLDGLCAGRVQYDSVIGTAYTTTVDTADSLTIFITALIESLQYQANDTQTNGDIIFGMIDEATESTTATDIYNAVLGIFEDVVTDMEDIKWAYMYGDDFDYSNLENFELPEHSIVYLQYTNNWNKETADYLDSVLSDLINEIVTATQGSDISTLFNAAINKDLYKEEYLDMLVEKVVGLLVNLNGTIRGLVDAVLDTDIEAWFDYCDIETDADGKVVSVTCNKDWNITGKDSFVAALAEVLEPAHSLISWLFFGTDYKFFTGTEQNPDGTYAYNDIITINGGEGYSYGLVPILEALGCTMNYEGTDSGIKPASAYLNADGTYDVGTAVTDVLYALTNKIDEVGEDPIDVLLALLPNVVYFINADGVKVSVNNLMAPVYTIIEKLSPVVGDINIDEAIGFPLSDITWNTIFDILEQKLNLYIPEKCQELITSFFIGDVEYFTSANGRGAFYMSYNDEESRRDMLTIILSLFVDVLSYDKNEDQFTTWFGSDIYSTIKNMLNIKEAKPMQDFSWYYTEYANTDKTFTAIESSNRYTGTYNEYWTKDKAQYVVDHLEAFIGNFLCLSGLQIDGIKIENLDSIIEELVEGNIYTQANADAILNGLKDAMSQLTSLEPYGKYIAGALKNAIGFDVHAWDNMTVTVTDGDRASFTAALSQIAAPAVPLINVLLNGEDISLLLNIEGEDAITIPGSEGYAYGIVPILEALGCENVLTPDEYKAAIAADPNAAIKAIVDPVFDKIEAVKADPANEILNMLPAVIYFINSNGLDTCFKNIVNTVDTVLMALEPAIGEQTVESFLGIDLSTYDFEYLINFALDAVKESTGYDLTPFAMDLIAEFTVGKVVTYQSKNGETYYTMEYASELDKADMLTIVLRVAIDFITSDENIEKVKGLLKEYIPNEDNYKSVCTMLESLAKSASEDPGMGQALYVLYYIFYGLENALEETDDIYHDVNNSWQFILKLLTDSNEPILSNFANDLKGFLNKYFEGIFDDEGVASNGFIEFFKKIAEFFKKIAEFFRNLFNIG